MSQHNRRGILTMTGAMVFFVVNDALVKWVSTDLPTPQLIFVRGVMTTALLLALAAWMGQLRLWRSALTRSVPTRALVDSLASFTYLTAVFHMPLGNATAINLAGPLFLTMLAVFFLHERVSLGRWALILLGFAGVLLVVQPRAGEFNSYAWLCLLAAMLHAGRDFLTRLVPAQVPSLLITLSTAMMVTLLGAAVSDALEDGRVVSGVGGQYNFVAMAHALPDARSLICLRSTRESRGRVSSNLVWNYGHTTIPRHLRDLVITEYGIADLRGRTDAECIAALLNIADSRFQPALLAAAKTAGKLPREHQIPEAFRRNSPEQLERTLAAHRRAGLFSEYPFGTDLSAEEVHLSRALQRLRDHANSPWRKLMVAAASILRRPGADDLPLLRRLGLEQPANHEERRLRGTVLHALSLERRTRDLR